MLPHRVCINFDGWLTVVMIVGDGLTALAYCAIPVLIAHAVMEFKRHANGPRELWDLYVAYILSRERPINTLFQAFIIACGCGHIMKIWVLYQPHYWLQAIIDLWTGIISFATVVALWLVKKGLPKQ